MEALLRDSEPQAVIKVYGARLVDYLKEDALNLQLNYLHAAFGFLLTAMTFSEEPAFAKPKANAKILPAPKESQSLETASRAIGAVSVDAKHIAFLPKEGGFFWILPFVSDQNQEKGDELAKRQARFGKIGDQRRGELAAGPAALAWAGAVTMEGRSLFLDGRDLIMIEVGHDSLKEMTRRSIPWDLIRPPRDRSGEPTVKETQALRANFKRRFLATEGQKIVGITRAPASWYKTAKSAYLLVTRIPDFPLLMLECDKEEPTSCTVARQCYVEAQLTSENLVGIGALEKPSTLLIGDRKARRLKKFRFDSCYHVTTTGEILLPEKLKTLTNLAVDDEARLWLSTAAPDDYLNASIFFWNKSDWW